MSSGAHPRVYLAGPDVFAPDAATVATELKHTALGFGLEPLWPLDNEINGAEGDDRYRLAAEIARLNLALIDSAHGVIANLSPFRGPNMDPGTAFELGYAAARGLPLFAWSADRRTLIERTLEWIPSSKRGHVLEGCDRHRRRIEDFGLTENLMIAIPAGRIHRSPAEAMLCAANELSVTRLRRDTTPLGERLQHAKAAR